MAGEQGLLSREGIARYRVFGAGGFAGNPATLVECDELPPREVLLARARTLDAGDTVFFARAAMPRAWQLRFFSPNGEILVCGHALLALARHLGEREGRELLLLESPYFAHQARWQEGEPWVSLPAYERRAAADHLLHGLLARAGLHVEDLALCSHRVWLARCASAAQIAGFDAADFDWTALSLLAPGALVLTAPLRAGEYGRGGQRKPEQAQRDPAEPSAPRVPREYALRYFAPWHGKPEDSATGSAQSCLAPYWLRDGEEGLAHQLSPAGEARLRVAREGDRVWLSGQVAGEAGS